MTVILLSDEVQQNACDLYTLDNSYIRDAEGMVRLLKPLKTATTLLCDEESNCVSHHSLKAYDRKQHGSQQNKIP